MFKIIKEYLKSKQEYEVRFAIVMLLDYYINDQYIDQVLQILNNIKLIILNSKYLYLLIFYLTL